MRDHTEHELPSQRSDSLQAPRCSGTLSYIRLDSPKHPVIVQDFKALNAQFISVLALVLLGKPKQPGMERPRSWLIWPGAPQGLISGKQRRVQTSPDGTRFPEHQEESQQTPPSSLFMNLCSSAWPLSSTSLLSSFYSLPRVARHRTPSRRQAPSTPSFAFSPAFINARACL